MQTIKRGVKPIHKCFVVSLALALSIVMFSPSAEACQKCKIDDHGCQVCSELPYNGAQSCVLQNGSYCQLQGSCEDPVGGEEGCGGSPPEACIYNIYSLYQPRIPVRQEWRLVRVTITTPAKAMVTPRS